MTNLKFNYPSLKDEGTAIRSLIAETDFSQLLSFPSYQGNADHLDIARKYLGISDQNYRTISNIVLCNSGNHSISCIIQALRSKHNTIITEPFTYPAFKAIALNAGFNLVPGEFDSEGLTPEGLEAAIAKTNAKIVYVQPTIQNPTCAVMPLERRKRIAQLATEKNLILIEDDAYRFLHPDPPLRFLDLVPERTIHIFSLAKPFNSFLKTAYLVIPDFLTDEIVEAVRLNSSGHSALLGNLASRLLRDDALQTIIEEKRATASRLQARLLPLIRSISYQTFPTSFHLWMKLPNGKRSSTLVKQLSEMEIVAPAGVEFATDSTVDGESFMRIALGAENDVVKLERSMHEIVRLLSTKPVLS